MEELTGRNACLDYGLLQMIYQQVEISWCNIHIKNTQSRKESITINSFIKHLSVFHADIIVYLAPVRYKRYNHQYTQYCLPQGTPIHSFLQVKRIKRRIEN